VGCCFEDVHAGQERHRRWHAEWPADRYGIAVPELTKTRSSNSTGRSTKDACLAASPRTRQSGQTVRASSMVVAAKAQLPTPTGIAEVAAQTNAVPAL
jgi:hypothetical protein